VQSRERNITRRVMWIASAVNREAWFRRRAAVHNRLSGGSCHCGLRTSLGASLRYMDVDRGVRIVQFEKSTRSVFEQLINCGSSMIEQRSVEVGRRPHGSYSFEASKSFSVIKKASFKEIIDALNSCKASEFFISRNLCRISDVSVAPDSAPPICWHLSSSFLTAVAVQGQPD
jgi:hypothetical protein